MVKYGMLIGLVIMCAMYAQQGPPPVPEANYEVIHKLDYADDAAARAAWHAGVREGRLQCLSLGAELHEHAESGRRDWS